MQTRTTNAQARGEVIAWRCEQLVRSDFARMLAVRIAANAHYDLHPLIELVERGCEPELAVRILAPVEEPAA
jgi:hypothetical protein